MNGQRFATSNELNGLGERVNKVEAFREAQLEINKSTARDVKENKDDIRDLFILQRGQQLMAGKIIGAVAVIQIILTVAAIAIPIALRSSGN